MHYHRHRPPPSPRRYQIRCFRDFRQILLLLLTPTRPGNPRRHSRHPRLRSRDLRLRRRWMQDRRPGELRPGWRRTSASLVSWIM